MPVLSALETAVFLLPVLLALIAGTATVGLIFERGRSGVKIAASLLIWGILSLQMLVFSVGYLIGPDCVFCYQPRKLWVAAEFFLGVMIYGLIGRALVRWVRRAKV